MTKNNLNINMLMYYPVLA